MEVVQSNKEEEEVDPLRGDADPNLLRKRRRRKRCICISVSVVAVLLALALLILILALTVFKAKRPVTSISSVSLRNMDLDLDILRLSVSLNVTLDASVSVSNPNKVAFKFTNSSTAFVRYRDNVVAQVPIPAGRIAADKSTSLNVTITVLADRLLSDSHVYSDIISGTLPLTTSTRIAGKVRIVCFNVRVVSYTTCDLNVDVSSRSIRNQTCHYRTKF